MSNNLIAVSSNLPAYLQGGQVGYQDTGLGAGITPRAPKLAVTTAKQWTITKDGQQMVLPTPTVKAVLLASASNITKAWYAKAYTPGSTEAPDCYSDDGRTPAAGVKAPQCSNCAMCPKNAFGSHPVTGRGKACADRKRVVLVWEGMPDTLATFNVPTMSLQGLLKLDTELRSANIPLQSVLVELSFDPSIAYPVVKIGAVGFVDEGTARNLIAKANSEEVLQLLRESEYDEAMDNTSAPETPVPQNTVQFGLQQPASGEQQQQAQQPTESPAQKRRRRTKAEMEAARAAEAAATGQQQAQQPVRLDLTPMQQTEQTGLPGNQLGVANVQTSAPAGGLDIGALLNKWQNG